MIFNVLIEQGCPPPIIKHSIAVKNKALKLAKKFDSTLDLDLIKTGALLHDIGRSKTHKIDHALVGANILKELGFEENIIKIVERHIGAGIPSDEAVLLGLPEMDFIPQTLEEKIVAHADNLINGTREISLELVVKKWNLPTGHSSIRRLYKLHYDVTGEKVTKQLIR